MNIILSGKNKLKIIYENNIHIFKLLYSQKSEEANTLLFSFLVFYFLRLFFPIFTRVF